MREVVEPWTESMDVRDSMGQLGRDAHLRGFSGLAEMYFHSALRRGTEVLTAINQDTERRIGEL